MMSPILSLWAGGCMRISFFDHLGLNCLKWCRCVPSCTSQGEVGGEERLGAEAPRSEQGMQARTDHVAAVGR